MKGDFPRDTRGVSPRARRTHQGGVRRANINALLPGLRQHGVGDACHPLLLDIDGLALRFAKNSL